MRDDKTPDILIERAVELWRRAIIGGDWDNGDAFTNAFTNALRSDLKSQDHTQTINKWAGECCERLKFLRDHDGTPMPESEWPSENCRDYEKLYHFDRCLSVDYNVTGAMAWAANKVGLSDRLFPCKSGVQMYYQDHVSASFGYGSPTENHYPMPNGDWLITDLSGQSDMPKIIAAVMDGSLAGLTVEKSQ